MTTSKVCGKIAYNNAPCIASMFVSVHRAVFTACQYQLALTHWDNLFLLWSQLAGHISCGVCIPDAACAKVAVFDQHTTTYTTTCNVCLNAAMPRGRNRCSVWVNLNEILRFSLFWSLKYIIEFILLYWFERCKKSVDLNRNSELSCANFLCYSNEAI